MAGYGFEKWCTAEQEWKIITTFLDELGKCDQLHFEDLFSYLFTVSCTEIQNLCNSLTISQKHDFFKNRPTYFIVKKKHISKAMSSDALRVCAHKKFCSSARYILQCFGSVHYLEIKKVITFVFEDVAHYILKLLPEEEKQFMKNIRNVVNDGSGVLTLTTSRKVGTKRVSPEEKCLLAIVYYLGLHDCTHFKKLFEEIEKFAKKECELVLGDCSDANRLMWLKKHVDYFQVHEDNFVSLYEEYSSYKCDYQKLKSEPLPLQAEPTCSDLESSHLSQEVQILTSVDEQNAHDNIVTFNRTICKKFYISATYLTSCFNPLHYLEVKECIFFIMEDVANVLRKLTLSGLQKIFEKVPFTSMDENGFLNFREDCNFDTSFVTNEEMLNLFFVYYLGFCGKTHFEKVIQELMKRAPEAVCNSIAKLSVQDQLKYFKQFPQYFGVSKRGELNVNASFVLPYFEYKNDTVSESNSTSKESSISSEKCTVIRRISSSIAFLLNFFQLKLTCRPLRLILHVLNDAKVHFLNLSALDQIDLVKDIFSPFTVNERGIISFAGNQFEIKHLAKKEMEFLYFAYLISESDRLHYRQAIDRYFKDTGKIPKRAYSDSLRFRYFKEAEGIFQIGSDGYITLCSLPRLDLVPSFLSEVVKTINPELSLNQYINFTSNDSSQVNCSFKPSSRVDQKSSYKVNVSYATHADYKKFCGAVSFLLTYFNSLHYITLKRIISLVLTDVGNFFNELPVEEQDKIFKSIPSIYMDENGCMHLASFSNGLHSFVSRNKRQFLFIVCFLVVNGQTHYIKILSELQNHQIIVSNFTSSQFYGLLGKYPKYFTRNSNGYIRLSHAFSDVNVQHHINFVPSSNNQKLQTTSFHQNLSSTIQSVNACVNSALPTKSSFSSSSRSAHNQFCTSEDVKIRDDNILNSNIKIQSKPSELKYPLYKKIQDGISYLLQYFTLNVKSEFLQVLFLVLDDYEIFNYSSTNDKIGILKTSLSVFKVNEDGMILSCITFDNSCLMEREKEELLISFIVFEQKELHFLKVFQQLGKYNLVLPPNTLNTSAKFHYFKKRKDIFHIDNDGYVSLLNWPHINLPSSTVLECFSSVDDLVKSENNCHSDLTKKISHDECSNLSSIDQSESVWENKDEREKDDNMLGVDETSLPIVSLQFNKISNLCSDATQVQNVDNSPSESEKDENKSNDGYVSLNRPLISLDSSTTLECFSSTDYINLVKSEDHCQTGNQIDECSSLNSSTNKPENVCENKDEKEQDKILEVDETSLSAVNACFDRHSILCSNMAEVENVYESLSENENGENISSELVKEISKFDAKKFSPSREWFTVQNDPIEEANNGNLEKVQLEKATPFLDTYKTENICKIIEKDDNLTENAAIVTKFNPNLFSPSKEWFSPKIELSNSEDCGTKPKNVKKSLNRIKSIAPSSNSVEAEKVIVNIEKLKCVQSDTLEKDVTFNLNLPISTNKLSSADILTKEASIHKTCDKLHGQHSSSQQNVMETVTALIQSITSLLKYYNTKVNWLLVCGVFQVMNDVTNKFFVLSKDDQSYVLKRIFTYFSSSDKVLDDLERSYLDKCKLTEEQENLLLMTCILSREKKMDYLQLFKKFETLKNDFQSYRLTDSDKYQYVVKRNNIFSIEAGIIKLHPFPHLKLKSQVLEADLKVWKEMNSRQEFNQQPYVESKKEMPGNNLQMFSSKIHLKPSKLNHIGDDKPKISNYSASFCLALELQTAMSLSWPKKAPKIFGELKSCTLFLKKSGVKVDWHSVCAIFQVMNEVRGKFLLLSKDIQTKMLYYIFLDIEKISSIVYEVYLENYPLNEEQEILLLMACIIALEEKLHYLKLFEKFGTVKKSIPSDMQTNFYEYISKQDHLFSMEDGYVKLLPFPSLELKRRVLDADLKAWRTNNCQSFDGKFMNVGLGSDLQACSTTVKSDFSNLNHIADKLNGPKILRNANQSLSPNLKTIKCLSKSYDMNLENKSETPISTTQLKTFKFDENIDKSTSTINEKTTNDGLKVLKNDLLACSTTVKSDLSNLNHIADKLTRPKILSNANQSLSSRFENFEEKTVKCFSRSCDTNLENISQTPISTTQFKTLKFNNKNPKVDKSTSTNEEIIGTRFQPQSSLTQLEPQVFDSNENDVDKRVLEEKSQSFGSVTDLEVSKFNKTCKDITLRSCVKTNDVVLDVNIDCLEEKTNKSSLLKDLDLKNDLQVSNSVIESKDRKLNAVAKEVHEAETLNVKLDSNHILLTSNSIADYDDSKPSGLKEFSEIPSIDRKKKVLKNKSHDSTSINDSKISRLEEKSCELSNEDSKVMTLGRNPVQDSNSIVESNVLTCEVNLGEGMKKQASELSSIKNKEKVSKNKSQACGSKTKLKSKKENNEKVAKTDESPHITSVTEVKSSSPNITEKQIAQSLTTNAIERASECRSSPKAINHHKTEASKSICLEEKDLTFKNNNIVAGQSKTTRKVPMKAKSLSKASSPVSKECLNKLCKKMQAGIAHLLKYFHLTTENLLLKVLFHVLGSSKIFCELPNDEQIDFLQNCFHIFHLDKKGGIVLSLSNETNMVKLKHEEKILLSVTSILSQWKELHYRKIFQQLQNQISVPADKEQFNFFRKKANLFSIASNGYVKLYNFPDIEINSAIFASLFQAKTTVENETSKQEVSIQSSVSSDSGSAAHKKEQNLSGSETLNSKAPSITGVKVHTLKSGENHTLKVSSSAKLKMLDDICKKVKDAIHFLLNYFKLVSEPHLVCVILHALKDVRSNFEILNTSDQDKFIEESLRGFCTDSNGQISKVFSLSRQFNLSNNDKDMLFLCFILGQVKELHYQEIFDKYSQYQRIKPTSVVSPLDMPKYFSERGDLFSMNSDGYVKLNLQFVVEQNSKILPISSISPNSKIVISPLLNSVAFKNIQNTQQIKICEMQLSEKSNKQVQENDFKSSMSLETKHERFKESAAFLNSQPDRIASDCAEVIILHVLNDLRDLDHNERERLLSISAIDSNYYTLTSSKSWLSEEEKDLLVIAYVLIQSGPLHYCKLFELLEKQNRDSLKILTEPEQYQYILQQSKYFSVTSQGTVSFNAISNTDIENYNHFNPESEEYFKISLSKSISTENDSCCDVLIDSFIKDNDTDKNKNKPKGAFIKTSHKPTFNLLEIITEESSSVSTSFHSAKSKAFNLIEFPDAPKTSLEQQCVYFFATILTNEKMANSVKEHLHLASEDIQKHLKDCYDENINHFLEIHQMSASSF
ncbi:unnamed protein product [Larinioides sclopetarius]|uniref:Uncharacterized protein n=1 Tax=Larinioides sclopetarius TaxID=280406 RepID=A0AAV2B4E7_9ARAC